MKFLIDKERLNYAIQNVQRAISPRSPLPILTGILFQCGDGALKLSATDMEMSINSSVPADVREPGELVIPARYIADFAKKLPDVPIEFESIGGGKLATIRYGQSEFNINGYSAADFPVFQVPDGEFTFSMEAGALKDIIRKVIYASSNDDSRPVFTGVLFEVQGNDAALVATDTFRLAMKRFKIETQAPELINVIVPGKTLNEAVRVMGGEEPVKVTLSRNHIVFETEDTVVASRLISGRFPSYRQVIPNSFSCVITASIRDMLDSADRASLLAGERNSLVMFQSTREGVVISVRSENGWIREDIPASTEGENFDILFNVRYLSDVLRSCDGEQISIKLTGTYTPALLTPPDDEDYVAIIVPARTSRE
ncbi:MAG: DNA polymerase III subunit beta [Peptococcaceae bacterium]|nr:DNA polymerase III subunit beta [Peptococcaceae bacterium]